MTLALLWIPKICPPVLFAVSLSLCQSRLPGVVCGWQNYPRHKGAVELGSQTPQVRGSVQELVEKAVRVTEKERFREAIPLLQAALIQAPSDGAPHHYLGYVLWRDHQPAAARAEFDKALKLNPGDVYTQYFLARIAYTDGDVTRATERYEAIVASGVAVYDTRKRLGQVYFRLGHLSKALEMIQQALQETPWDGALHFQLAKVYRQMGRREESQREFHASERLKQADQTSIQQLVELSEAIRQKDRAAALKLRDELLRQPSKDSETLVWLGTLLGQGKFYEEALLPLQEAEENSPVSYEAKVEKT